MLRRRSEATGSGPADSSMPCAVGHPFTALILTVFASFYWLGTRCGYSRAEIQRFATKSLEPVGLIILVTGAGGVFGKVLIAAGVGETLAQGVATTSAPMIVLAFLIAALVRVTQGSATVAMVTAAGLLGPLVATSSTPPISLALITISIASGATVLSHFNDSGFWLVSRYLGLTEKDTLRSWTVMETVDRCDRTRVGPAALPVRVGVSRTTTAPRLCARRSPLETCPRRR